jgi:hypothetical protein
VAGPSIGGKHLYEAKRTLVIDMLDGIAATASPMRG